jgi:hypothetical protein
MNENETNVTIDSNFTNPVTTLITTMITQTSAPSKDYLKNFFLSYLINLSSFSKI